MKMFNVQFLTYKKAMNEKTNAILVELNSAGAITPYYIIQVQLLNNSSRFVNGPLMPLKSTIEKTT